MNRLFLFLCAALLSSCSALILASEPQISLVEVKQVSVKMISIFPDYKNVDEERKLIEITFISDQELIAKSLKNSMTLIVNIGYCSNLEHLPSLAFNTVFYKRKTIRQYLMLGKAPEPESSSDFEYQAYINLDNYQKTIAKNGEKKLCLNVAGASYLDSFVSNRIEIPIP